VFEAKGLAKTINWRDRGFVMDVKDQLECGSSYIFAVVGAIESHNMISKNQSLEPLSE
jgi:C1A family cysteine protease